MNTPQIKLKGWWWKRFFPKYRKLRLVLQLMSDRFEPERREMLMDMMLYGTAVMKDGKRVDPSTLADNRE